MTREEIHQRFVAEFHKGQLSPVLDSEEFRNVELVLNTLLPEAYISFMRIHGPVSTHTIILDIVPDDMAVDKEVGFWALWDIWPLSECVYVTQLYWSGGMSKELVGFAADPAGNLFCFRRQSVSDSRTDDSAVWLFDHDFCEEKKLADSFDNWLFSYLKLKNPELVR